MSQNEILEIIREHPGIMQKEMGSFGLNRNTVSEQIRVLARKKLIRREYVKTSFKLYAEK